ncbi:MAG: hypothetical protein ACP5P2_02805 [Candidatus Micrarchaeia archaeon]
MYRQKNGKYIIYLPYDVVSALKLKEDDELDFFKFGENSFLMAKKEDIAALLSRSAPKSEEKDRLSEEEISVLKKLDTIKYSMRSKQNVEKLLSNDEKRILSGLIKKNVVKLFSSDGKELYSISKNVYDRFLMRKKENVAKEEGTTAISPKKEIEARYSLENKDVKRLEEKGYIVLQTEAEAAGISIALEDSIKQGLVLGTRSFNKKFYIVLRSFFEKYAPQVVKILSGGEAKVEDLARMLGIEEEAVRGILCLLAESGDVSEKKKDLFVLT